MDLKLILVVIGVIAMAFGRSEALTCYLCESASNSSICLDPFKSNGVGTCQGPACVKAWATVSGMMAVERYCYDTPVTSNECIEITRSGVKVMGCLCGSDYCNDGQSVKPTLYNVVIGTAMATVTAIAWMNKI